MRITHVNPLFRGASHRRSYIHAQNACGLVDMVVVASYNPDMTLAECLMKRGEELGLPGQKEVAQAVAGVNQSTVSRWLSGAAPGDDKAPLIAEFLAVTEDEAAMLIYRARREQTRTTSKALRAASVVEFAKAPIDRLSDRVAELEERVFQLETAIGAPTSDEEIRKQLQTLIDSGLLTVRHVMNDDYVLAAQGDPADAAQALDPKRRRKRPSPKAPSE